MENGVDFLDLCKDALTSLAPNHNILIEHQKEAAEVQELEKNQKEEMIVDQNNTTSEEALDQTVSDVIANVVKAAEESNPEKDSIINPNNEDG